MSTYFHSQPIEEILKILKTTENGLTPEEARRRLKEVGENVLPRSAERITRLKILLSQFKSPLIFILIIAGAVSGILKETIDMAVIFITVAINAVVGFIQEDKANQALKKLRSMIEYSAVVIRGGRPTVVPSQKIAPGDILLVEAGDKIQADGRIMEATDLSVNEAVLTGESEPNKKSVKILRQDIVVADRTNMLYRGTIAVKGRARMVVTGTGIKTELGKIASLVKATSDDKTPLQMQLGKLSKYLAVIVLTISTGIFLLGVFVRDGVETVLQMFKVAVAVAVAAIPEGLVITLTVILAVGMRHILKRNALVRKLVAAETLGSVSVICTDKTGTITEGKMRLTRIISAGDDLDFAEAKTLDISKQERHKEAWLALRIGVLANDGIIENSKQDESKWKLTGDTTDLAFLHLGAKVGLYQEYLETSAPRLAEIPFSSEKKYMATRHAIDNEYAIYVKGAAEVILEKCEFFDDDGKTKPLSKNKKIWFQEQIDNLTDDGLRVLTVTHKRVKEAKKELTEEDVDDLSLVAIVGLSDPVRPDVKETIQLAARAGIKTVMITGDHIKTARTIARQIGLSDKTNEIFDGNYLDKISDDELAAAVERVSIFARVDPAHKIRIVRAFQANGEVVAMTGDGVNDAPAIKAADIGIALGSGTDVAREIADLVLLDDAYSTIVASVEEGRGIYQNVKKIILYLLSGSFAEVILIGGSLMVGLPLAILPAQILWVNIIEDAFPNMALAFDKGDKENMSEGPRRKGDALIDKEMKIMIAIISIVSNLILFGLFVYFIKTGLDLAKVRTLMFVGLGIDSLIYIYSVRSMRHMVWRKNPFSNHYLNLALLFGWLMLIGAVHWFPLQTLLRTVGLELKFWVIMFIFGILNIVLIELVKGLFLVWRNKRHLTLNT